jgi:hypothetical protein
MLFLATIRGHEKVTFLQVESAQHEQKSEKCRLQTHDGAFLQKVANYELEGELFNISCSTH